NRAESFLPARIEILRSLPAHKARRLSGFIERGFGLLCDGGKSGGLVHRQIREHLAIDVDTGLLEAIDETAVAQVELAGRRVDALDPQRAEVAFLEPAAAICVLAGLDDGLLRSAEYLATGVVVALRLLENFLVACTRSDAAFDSCHGLVLACVTWCWASAGRRGANRSCERATTRPSAAG